ELLESVFQELNPQASSTDLKAELLQHLGKVMAKLDADQASEPKSRARLRNTLGLAQLNLGEVRQAIVLLERGLEERQALLGPDHADTLTSMNNLALAYQAAGQYAKVV